ncbi:MAG: hypothetical protein OXU74_07185 [Gemmatimonadota bacterium]|nr:hypothetical protein [Gemmatimonadota bacterium]
MTLPLIRVRSRNCAAVRVLLLSTMSLSAPAVEAQTPVRFPTSDGGVVHGPRLWDAIVGFPEGLGDAWHPRPSPRASADTEAAGG